MRHLLIISLLAYFLSGCGQTGPLYLPQDGTPAGGQTTESSPNVAPKTTIESSSPQP